jgi:hypothetical protein
MFRRKAFMKGGHQIPESSEDISAAIFSEVEGKDCFSKPFTVILGLIIGAFAVVSGTALNAAVTSAIDSYWPDNKNKRILLKFSYALIMITILVSD